MINHVGFETQTSAFGKWVDRNSKPSRRAPAPDKVWTVATLSADNNGDESPNSKRCASRQNDGRPFDWKIFLIKLY